jgi:hypothetical protein
MSLTQVVFPDATKTVIDYLSSVLGGTTVCGRVPNARPTEFVRVERVGGPRETRVSEAARFVVEAWAATDGRAAELLNDARGHLFDLDTGVLFGVDEYGGPTRLPDPTTNMCRYTASLTIRVRPIP